MSKTPERCNIGELMCIYERKQFGVKFNMIRQIGIVTTNKCKYKHVIVVDFIGL
jgi:hypothetical protein